MPDLSFRVEGCESVPFAATPTLAFKLAVTNANPEETIHSVALRAQIQIEAARRRYTAGQKEALLDLFGEPERWGTTLKSMLWTHAGTVISAFQGSTAVDLQVHCTFDFNVAATKYFHGASMDGGEGEIPLNLLFSGSVFYAGPDGALQVAPIPWDREARAKVPVQTWRGMMNHYYPNSAWLALRRDVFERVYRFKVQRGLQTWEETLDVLLAAREEEPVRQ